MKHLRYLQYVLLHKYYVLIELWKRGFFWAGIVHDMSKFTPLEWFPYVEFWYGEGKNKGGFHRAWFWHQKCNKHHWQYWTWPKTDGTLALVEIPFRYCVEMVCDWIGAGKAQGTELDAQSVINWYHENKHKFFYIHPKSKVVIEAILLDHLEQERKSNA